MRSRRTERVKSYVLRVRNVSLKDKTINTFLTQYLKQFVLILYF